MKGFYYLKLIPKQEDDVTIRKSYTIILHKNKHNIS